MEHNPLNQALCQLPERLADLGYGIGSYSGYTSTSKGITLSTAKGSLFLYHSFIHKLIWQPDTVTDEDLSRVALNIK